MKVRTIAVPERPREYLSKVAALVHAGHNGDALIQAVQSVEPREQRPPRQHAFQLGSLAETPTPDELVVASPRVPEGLRQVSIDSSASCVYIIYTFSLPRLSYRPRTSSDYNRVQEDVNGSMETDEWDPLEVVSLVVSGGWKTCPADV